MRAHYVSVLGCSHLAGNGNKPHPPHDTHDAAQQRCAKEKPQPSWLRPMLRHTSVHPTRQNHHRPCTVHLPSFPAGPALLGHPTGARTNQTPTNTRTRCSLQMTCTSVASTLVRGVYAGCAQPIIRLISSYPTRTSAPPSVRSTFAAKPLNIAEIPSSLMILTAQSSVPLYSH